MKPSLEERRTALLDIQAQIPSILYKNEEPAFSALSKKGRSMYLVITKELDQYVVFRFSDHKTNQYFSNKRFDSRDTFNEDSLVHLREHLDKASWYIFTRNDYLTLQVVKFLANKNQGI